MDIRSLILFAIKEPVEKKGYLMGVGYDILDISNIKLLKQADSIKCGNHKNHLCATKYYSEEV